MKSARTRRPANGRTPYRGLLPPDRPGDGVLVLDRNPRAGIRRGTAWLLGAILCVPLSATALLAALNVPRPGREGFGPWALMAGLSLVLAYAVLLQVRSLERIRLDASGLEYLRIDGLLRRRRVIPLPEIRRLTPYSVMVPAGGSQRFRAEYGVAIETIGWPLCVGQCRDPEEAERLREDLECHLQDRYAARLDRTACADCEILDASGTRPDPPSDSTLSCRREWDRTEFVRPIRVERLPRAWLYLLAFISPTIIILFLATLSTISAFLAMSAIAGLIGLWALGRRCWVVRPGEITTSVRVAGLGWSRTTEIEWLKRMELRRLPSKTPWDSRYELALIDIDDEDRAVFGPLTEGEARWMAGIVADVLNDAFPRGGQEIYRWSVKTDAPTLGSQAMADAWLDEGLAEPGVDKRPKIKPG